jgi:hypothetical protein
MTNITKEEFLSVWLDKNLNAEQVAKKLGITTRRSRDLATRFGYRKPRDAYCDRRAEIRRAKMPGREEFTEAWDDDELTRADIAERFGIAVSTLVALARRYDLTLERHHYMKTSSVIDPTPEEIAQRAAEVRAGWSVSRANRKEQQRQDRLRNSLA